MLGDQTFDKPPIILLGPEMFCRPDGHQNLDFEAIAKFSAKFCRFGFYQFVFAALERSQVTDTVRLATILNKMGVVFVLELLLNDNSPAQFEQLRDMHVILDFAYSPELHKVAPFPVTKNLDVPKDKVLTALLHFQDSIEPYTTERFRALTLT